MPPKPKKGKNGSEKVVKLTPQEIVAEAASVAARRLFKEHDNQRVKVEQLHKTKFDHTSLDSVIEAERLKRESLQYRELMKEVSDDELLAFKEYDKHEEWKRVPVASRLPDIFSQSAINTFLSEWQERNKEIDLMLQPSYVLASHNQAVNGQYNMRFMRAEQNVPPLKRQRVVDEQLDRCIEAFEVMQCMIDERNLQYFRSLCNEHSSSFNHTDFSNKQPVIQLQRGKAQLLERWNEQLQRVCMQIMSSLDFITVQSLCYYDIILTSGEGEMLMRSAPERNAVIKYGLWVKVKEVTRSFNTLAFPEIEIRLDPKLNAPPRLPKSLGLSRENIAVRVMQLAFNPYAGYDLTAKEFYPLNCTLKVDLITFSNRPKKIGDWLLRSETESTHLLHCEEYPPLNLESRNDDPAFRVSFNVPSSIVLRQPTLLIGKWTDSLCEWEPCSHATFNAVFTGTTRVEAAPRRATFITNELAHFAILQEKVYDASFHEWHIIPISYDKVIFTISGKNRNDGADRPIVILVEDARCKLLAPDYSELEELRENWHTPCSLFHALSQAGFNFILHDSDASFLENVLPKSKALEHKVYSDIAQFSQYFVIASTRHNKGGEDADMTLFRISKNACRKPDWTLDDDASNYDSNYNQLQSDMQNNDDVNYGHYMDERGSDDASWWHVRYRTETCAVCAFSESDSMPDLNVAQGHQTHLNLYSMLCPIHGEEALKAQILHTNYLLRRSIFEILSLTRPCSWG